MSNDITEKPSMTVNRTTARGMQFTPVCTLLGEWLGGTSKSISLPITFDEHIGTMNFASHPQKGDDKEAWTPPQADYRTYTFTQLKPIFKAMVEQGREFGGSAFEAGVPAYSRTRKDFANMFALKYTVSKGKNEGQVRNLVAHCMANVRNAHKRIDAKNLTEQTVKAGKAWYVEGDEKCVAHDNEKKARKAWARSTMFDGNGDKTKVMSERVSGGYGADWWVGIDKDTKNARLAEAKVYQQAESVGKVEQFTLNKLTLTNIVSMPAIQVCKLAKKAGAPKDVHTGSGAKNRCIAWFATDVKRLSGLNL